MPPVRGTPPHEPGTGRQRRAAGERPSLERTDEFVPDFTRRRFLQALSLPALAALAGCDGPPPDAVPYVRQPENVIPGNPRFYASAVLFDGYAQPVIAETHEGRPTKLEGNPDHPCSSGTTDAFTQAAIAELYNPERSAAPLFMGRPTSWTDIDACLMSVHEALVESQGEGFRILTGPISSPTLVRQLHDLLARYAGVRWHMMEGVGSGLRPQAIRHVYGDDYDLHLHPENADVIVSFDDDFLGPGTAQVVNAGRWAARRRRAATDNKPVLLHVLETTPSLTGTVASSRKGLNPEEVARVLAAMGKALGVGEGTHIALGTEDQAWIDARVRELRAAGPRALVVAGPYLPEDVQACAFAINHALNSVGTTLHYTRSVISRPAGDGSLASLARDIKGGRVKTLCIVGVNPVYAAAADLDFANALADVPQTLHFGLYDDETAATCRWHIPITHPLETWSDGRAVDGTATVLQPLVRSFLDVRSAHDLIHRLINGTAGDALSIVRTTWSDSLTSQDDHAWRRALDRGFVADTAFPTIVPRIPEPPVCNTAESPPDRFHVVIRPDPTIWDGFAAPNLWLQELPKPLTKVTWENVILIAPGDAQTLKVADGDIVEVAAGHGGTIAGPVWIQPGQAPRTMAVFLGYGRQRAGRLASALGYGVAALRTTIAMWGTTATVRRGGGHRAIATTQRHSDMGAFDFVKTVARGTFPETGEEDRSTLYPPRERGPVAWGMVIDLDLCIGCNACVVACQVENNVPVVGQDQVRRGREMHWLRVDRYFEGDADNPAVHFQPVPCMHCEQAPCEMGCPVHATTHSSEGLNQMVYNRCIGTRTCSSYCPYKVRRFNWLDYTDDAAPGEQAQRNPNVTVRGRGIMEKCTYCIQRINAGEIAAKKENRDLKDGEIRTACQAACPTRAIVFGNISQVDSAVGSARANPRNYSLLAELATHPRTTYLAKITDAETLPEAPA